MNAPREMTAQQRAYWDEFCVIAENARRKCFHCKVEAGLNPDPYAKSNPVPGIHVRRQVAR